MPKRFARRAIVFYMQLAAAVISLILGIASISKESAPIIQKVQESRRQAEAERARQEAQTVAQQIAQMVIDWQYRGHDGIWRYYSDHSGRFWARVNIEGTHEYCENPQLRHIHMASR